MHYSISEFDFLRLGGQYSASEPERLEALSLILSEVPELCRIMTVVRELNLPDAWIVSGAIYQTVWNLMTQRPLRHGIKDFDIVYFDGQDLSFEAEDQVIKTVNRELPDLSALLEVKNQARVHLWFQKRFDQPYRPLECSMDSLTMYASRTHAVAARMDKSDKILIHAPFGLANLFGMRLVPNYALDNERTYKEKCERMKTQWPELSILPWEA